MQTSDETLLASTDNVDRTDSESTRSSRGRLPDAPRPCRKKISCKVRSLHAVRPAPAALGAIRGAAPASLDSPGPLARGCRVYGQRPATAILASLDPCSNPIRAGNSSPMLLGSESAFVSSGLARGTMRSQRWTGWTGLPLATDLDATVDVVYTFARIARRAASYAQRIVRRSVQAIIESPCMDQHSARMATPLAVVMRGRFVRAKAIARKGVEKSAEYSR